MNTLTESLLRRRLLSLSLVFLATGVLWSSANLLNQRAFLPIIQIPLLLAIGCMALLLFSKKPLSLTPLRALELFLFGSAAAYMGLQDFAFIDQSAALGDSGMVLSGLLRTVSHYILLVIVYGMYIPNTWQRAAWVISPLAAAPVVATLFLWGSYPEIAETMALTHSGDFVDAGVLLIFGAAVAIGGTQIVGHYQRGQMKTAEMGFYRLRERIGVGGMGEVWLAEHDKLVRPAVIKLIRPERLKEGGKEAQRTVRRFEKEAQATAELRSPHTVEIYDFGVTYDQTFYYVMEYLNGIDLDTLVKKHGPVPPQRTNYLLQQACESLGEAHNHHLIHRDVKPANIFICRMGLSYDFIKVLDFGLVKTQTNGASSPQGDMSSELTMEGMTTGTPAFMAPELAVGQDNVDVRSDIYALGCVGYWLLTGELVFQRENPIAMIVDHVNATPVPPSQRTENDVPEELDRIILKCLEKDPVQRFQTAMELAEALSACYRPRDWSRDHAESWWKLHYPDS
ncbi:MAG: serine/threonine-protein kinase [Acidobacteriota bacterium]